MTVDAAVDEEAALGPRLDLSEAPTVDTTTENPTVEAVEFSCHTCGKFVGTVPLNDLVRLGRLLPHLKHALVIKALRVPASFFAMEKSS